ESMVEGQVSVEGDVRMLTQPFFVLATQNPVEFHGTYPLPEAQMDRFAMRMSLGYVEADLEVAILDSQNQHHPLETLQPCVTLDQVRAMADAIHSVVVSPELKRYMVEIVQGTRTARGVRLGASPRASLALMRTVQALAMFDGLDHVIPELIQEVALPVIAHRLSLDPQAVFSGLTAEQVVESVMEDLPVPS
ncbi:MAG: MoxR family ATPase, partial [Magnetococcales bacterium]|nr:MoxR family ATPase [Magnetococcales bacterium]